jgi:hypothetical protein
VALPEHHRVAVAALRRVGVEALAVQPAQLARGREGEPLAGAGAARHEHHRGAVGARRARHVEAHPGRGARREPDGRRGNRRRGRSGWRRRGRRRGRRRRGGHHHPGGVGDLGGGIAGDHAHGAGGDTAGEAGGAHRGERGLLRGPDEVALRLLLDEARHLRDDGVAHGELARPTDRHRVADHAGREHGEVGADGSGAEVETGGRDGVVGARRESADGQKRRREGETSTHGITSQNRGRSAARRAWHAQRCAGGSSVALRPRLSRGFAFVAPLPGTTRSAWSGKGVIVPGGYRGAGWHHPSRFVYRTRLYGSRG